MNHISRVDFLQKNNIKPLQLEGSVSINAQDSNVTSFKDIMGNMISEMNEVTNKPDKLLVDAVQGKADIHDVMSAIAMSELTVQTATTVTGKILQTYEKIMQIQI